MWAIANPAGSINSRKMIEAGATSTLAHVLCHHNNAETEPLCLDAIHSYCTSAAEYSRPNAAVTDVLSKIRDFPEWLHNRALLLVPERSLSLSRLLVASFPQFSVHHDPDANVEGLHTVHAYVFFAIPESTQSHKLHTRTVDLIAPMMALSVQSPPAPSPPIITDADAND